MMNVDINEVIPKLSGAKKSGDGWIAKCPSHNDKKASFSIKEINNGVLFHCFAGCDFEQIVQDLGLNELEQYEQREQKKRIIATYDYVDENGKFLYQAVRYEPKDFRVRRKDSNGDWSWSLADTKRVLYRLPEVLQAREDDFYVILCEGEKDADNVIDKLGLPATTVAQGANAWKDELAEYLFGLNIVILPDNDKPGKAFAQQVANSIYDNAQSVKIIELPNLAEKGDVSDWIENGGTREQLIELIEETSDWQVTDILQELNNNTTDFFISKSVNQWMEEAMKSPIPKTLFGEFWYEGEICILFADSNVGKSILAVQIADSITKGKQIGSLSCEIEPQQVLYFDFELNARQFGNRYGGNENGFLADVYEFDDNFTRIAVNPDGDLSGLGNFEDVLFRELESLIATKDAKVIIIDNITYLKNDNEKAKEALTLMKRLKIIKEKYGLSVLALAHTPKRFMDKPITLNDLAGSKMLINFCDSAFSIGKSSKDENLRYVKQIKERNTAKIYGAENVCVVEVVKPDNFLCFDFQGFGSESEHLSAPSNTQRQDEIKRVMELKREKKTVREINEITGISTGKICNLLKEGESQDSLSDVHFVQSSEEMNKMNTIELVDFPF